MARRRAACLALGIPFLAVPLALAQQPAQPPAAEEGPIQLEKVVVTGSYIPTSETVGPAPLDMATADKIQILGSDDILQTLKKITPSLSGNLNTGQAVNNGGSGESYVAMAPSRSRNIWPRPPSGRW